MARIFAYIVHKGGVVDDSAVELAAAARRIDPAASPTAIVTGWGGNSMPSCKALGASYAEVWKIANEALAYPNAELIRKALVKVLPSDSIVLVAHDHFGIDLAPGLSIKLNSAFVSDVLDIERRGRRRPQSSPPGIWRTGQRACSLRHFIGRGGNRASGRIQAAGRRRYHWGRRRQVS